MNFLAKLAYFTISIAAGLVLILAGTGSLTPAVINNILQTINSSLNLQISTISSGLLIILLYIRSVEYALIRKRRERNIAFQRPLGEVSITLAALEDVIRKTLKDIEEIKEIKPQIIASKKGVTVIIKTILSAETNIPEITSKMQNLIKDKLQNILNIEEDIIIKINIRKILLDTKKHIKDNFQEIEDENANIPYRQY